MPADFAGGTSGQSESGLESWRFPVARPSRQRCHSFQQLIWLGATITKAAAHGNHAPGMSASRAVAGMQAALRAVLVSTVPGLPLPWGWHEAHARSTSASDRGRNAPASHVEPASHVSKPFAEPAIMEQSRRSTRASSPNRRRPGVQLAAARPRRQSRSRSNSGGFSMSGSMCRRTARPSGWTRSKSLCARSSRRS